MGRPRTTATAAGATSELDTQRIGGWASVAFAFVITVLGSVDSLDLPAGYVWFCGLVWLPLAVWLLLDPPGDVPTWRGLAQTLTDALMLAATVALTGGENGTVGYLAIPLILVTTYLRGAVVGFGLTFAAVLARVLSPFSDLDAESTLRVWAGTGAVVVLVGFTEFVRRTLDRSAEQVQQVASRSERITNYSTEAIVITDAVGTMLEVNPSGRRLFFDDPLAVPEIGGACHDMLSLATETGTTLDCTTGCALAELCDGQSGSTEIYQMMGSERRPLIASAVALPGQHGAIEYLHSFRDITQLKQADEAKTMFLATASHELKTPLTVIRGFTQLLQARAENPEDVLALEAIEARSRELSEIIERLLLSSRIDAGRVDLDLGPHDLTALLGNRLADADTSLGRDVILDAPERVWAQVSDTGLKTVIDHLIDNAVKYSPEGEAVTVTVSVSATTAIVQVSDHGIGMSSDQAERCFEKFWQGEATDVRRFGGTGIGLYIVQSLVKGMRGTVAVESTRGVGSTFTIRLPRVASDDLDRADTVTNITAGRDAPKAAVDEFIAQLGIGVGGS